MPHQPKICFLRLTLKVQKRISLLTKRFVSGFVFILTKQKF